MEKSEIVIVGAGPGGLEAARVLSDAGRDVLVFESNRNPGGKVCAGGGSIGNLDIGIPKNIIEKEFSSMKFVHPKKTIWLKNDEPFFVTLDREALSKWQIKSAREAGAHLEFGNRVRSISDDNVITDHREIKYKYLIGADGSSSVVRRSLGLSNKDFAMGVQYLVPGEFSDLEVFMDIKLFGPWFGWVFPHNGFASIGAGADYRVISPSKLKSNLEQLISSMGYNYSDCEFQAAPISYQYEGFAFKNKYLCGEAAGLVSEFTGEGIGLAFKSGQDVAHRILDNNYRCTQIAEILKIKRYHSALAGIGRMNVRLMDVIQYRLDLIFSNRRLRKKFVDIIW
ncbi:MAG: NAD(P)/FAD-dependent oxidoreductase [Candidatus Altiarchaeota archaeon]